MMMPSILGPSRITEGAARLRYRGRMPVHPNAALITTFYEAFARRDAEAMIACYAPDVTFSDPVFPTLKGEEVFGMWRMLARRAKDLRIEHSGVEADDTTGRAHWDAHYTFSQTGRPVFNRIDARFVFAKASGGGTKITRHVDSFDLWRWAGMALGVKVRLLGWLPPVQATIRRTADKSLRAFLETNTA
jgi:ketosteroid isomerase-like protein